MNLANLRNQERLQATLIQQKAYLRQYQERIWHGSVKRSVKVLFHSKERRAMAEAKAWHRALKELEQIPVGVNSGSEHPGQRDALAQLAKAASASVKNLASLKSPEAKKAKTRLERHLVGLGIRYGSSDYTISKQSSLKLDEAFEKWKDGQRFEKARVIHDWERERLNTLKELPGFTEAILKDRWWMQHVFGWVTYKGCPVEIVAKYPHLADQLRRSLITRRVGYFNDGGLRLRRRKNSAGFHEEHVQLKVGGKMQSIMDANRRLKMDNGPDMTVKEVIQEFTRRKWEASELEYWPENGITHFNTYHWGKVLDDDEGWKKLPVFEVIDRAEVKEKYGLDLADDEYGLGYAASQSTVDIQLMGTHSYTVGLRPLGDGKFQVYPFGKYMRDFPQSATKKLFSSMRTVPGIIMYFDENIIDPRRDHHFTLFKCDQAGFKRWIDAIWVDARRARDGKMAFNYWERSCVRWTMKVLRKGLGDSFEEPETRISAFDPRINNRLARVVRAANKVLPRSVISWIMNVFSIPLGALHAETIETTDGEVVKVRTVGSQWWNHKVTDSPQMLCKGNQPCQA